MAGSLQRKLAGRVRRTTSCSFSTLQYRFQPKIPALIQL